ncbi:MAG: dihydrofolate reductase family protein [Pseudomonadota bacterium]
MRKIIAGVFQSLDGIMQAPGGPTEDPTGGFTLGGWSCSYWDEMMGDYMGGVIGGDYDLLLGRKTYEIFAAHWPFMTNDPIGEKFDRIAKYVVTSSTEPLGWRNSHAINGDAATGIAKLKAGDGPNLLIQGSTALYPALLEARLIDRLFVMTFPVVLGGGKRLFAAGVASGALTLVDHQVSTTGVIIASYEPAGPVPIGSFMLPELNDLERARQERMTREG